MVPPSQFKQFERLWAGDTGWRGVLTAVNNQKLGVRFMVTSFGFFLIAGFLALLMRVQLAVPENTFLSPERYNQFFTLHGATMMFLFAVPFLEGLALYILPMMIGSRDVAFPRLTAFSYWTYLFGGIIFYASFINWMIPEVGWFAYTPLSGPGFSGPGTDFWLLGLAMVEVAGLAAGVELVVTILKLRSPGMTLARMPLFAWTMLVVGVMMIFAFTPLLVASTLLELDRAAGTKFFDPNAGGSSLLWQHLFWFFGHPEVYIVFLPATGIVSSIVPAFAQRRLATYTLVVTAVIVTGFVSFGLWAHHMYATGLPELGLSFFAAASLMIGIASGIQVFAWIGTMWGSRPALDTPMLYVLGFLFIFTLGGFTGVMVAVVPFDWQVHDTFFIVAHFHYVLIGGVVFPVFGGLHYWLPKITGRLLHEGLGKWSFWLSFIGFNVTFFPMHIMGFLGMPRRVYTYPRELEIGGYNLVATIGAFMLGAGTVLLVVNFLRSLWRGRPAPDNPWRSSSLEWSVPSPPPVFTFLTPPVVQDRAPLWDDRPIDDPVGRRATEALTAAPADWRATLATDPVAARPEGIQILAGPSIQPLIAATGLFVALLGPLTKAYLLMPLGLIVMALSILRWIQPDEAEQARRRVSDLPKRSGLPVLLTGHHSSAWWGALSAVAIAGTAMGAIFFAYFYIWLFSTEWPQAGLPLGEWWPLAALGGLWVVAAGANYWGWRGYSQGNQRRLRQGLLVALFLGVVYLIAQLVMLLALPYDWTVNAYASCVWMILTTFMILGGVQVAVFASVLWRLRRPRPMPEPALTLHLQIVTMGALFMGGTAVSVFGVLQIIPRLLL
jgi:cytochrome c oxidase subunit I+III